MDWKAAWGAPASIRVRLGAALAVALLPVLILGIVQSALTYNRDAEDRREDLLLAARRSAATAQARIESGAIVLETLTPQAVGLQCAHRLAEVIDNLPGYSNLIRFDIDGRVVCAADGAPTDADRHLSEWFGAVERGDRLVITRAAPGQFGADPSILAVVRAERDGKFDGALAAVIRLSSLQPDVEERFLPNGSEVALADSQGRFIIRTDPFGFPPGHENWLGQAKAQGAFTFKGRDARDRDRVYAVSRLVADDLFVVLSAPEEGLLSWTRVNLLSSVAPPLLAFFLALGAVWVVTERVVIRWLHYLQRVAAIYAKGRFTVRAVHAANAPPEIRELAHTLDQMADTILERDQDLRESLAHKDGLMREIHHRVKNNLQVISSLVSMQQRALTDPAARAAMQDTRQRISALSLVYRALYQGPDLKRVDLKQFLGDLTAQLIAAEAITGHAVRTHFYADELSIDPDKLAPLALFAVEAITNAQKHAFAGRGGELNISFTVDGDESELSIADSSPHDGPAPAIGEGVGRTLMTAFARQLGGRATFETNADGVTARLIFPTPCAPPRHAAPPKLKRNQARR